MENSTMTLKEVLEATIDILGGISIPAALVDQVGIPVRNAMSNLTLCVQAMSRNKAEKKPEEEDADGQAADAE